MLLSSYILNLISLKLILARSEYEFLNLILILWAFVPFINLFDFGTSSNIVKNHNNDALFHGSIVRSLRVSVKAFPFWILISILLTLHFSQSIGNNLSDRIILFTSIASMYLGVFLNLITRIMYALEKIIATLIIQSLLGPITSILVIISFSLNLSSYTFLFAMPLTYLLLICSNWLFIKKILNYRIKSADKYSLQLLNEKFYSLGFFVFSVLTVCLNLFPRIFSNQFLFQLNSTLFNIYFQIYIAISSLIFSGSMHLWRGYVSHFASFQNDKLNLPVKDIVNSLKLGLFAVILFNISSLATFYFLNDFRIVSEFKINILFSALLLVTSLQFVIAPYLIALEKFIQVNLILLFNIFAFLLICICLKPNSLVSFLSILFWTNFLCQLLTFVFIVKRNSQMFNCWKLKISRTR